MSVGPSPVRQERIDGPQLTFCPIEERDLPQLMRMRSDAGVVEFLGQPPKDLDQMRRHFIEPDVNPVWRFIIEHERRCIGEIQYWHQYPGHQYEWSAGIDIFIGEPDGRDRGLGTEAVRTMLRYLFEVKHCHRVTIDPEAGNGRAIRCYEKAGFRFDGVLRHNAFEHGEYVDTYFMSMLEGEWPEARARWQASN